MDVHKSGDSMHRKYTYSNAPGTRTVLARKAASDKGRRHCDVLWGARDNDVFVSV